MTLRINLKYHFVGETDVLQQLLADGDEDDDEIQAPLEITLLNESANDGNNVLTAVGSAAVYVTLVCKF